MAVTPVKVGLIGCGNIAPAYLKFAKQMDILQIVALADLDQELARSRAEEFEIADVCSVDELLQREDVEIVLNLTPPKAHHAVSLKVLEAGKHLYNEKPLTATCDQAREVMELAEKKNLRVGCAPDTVLGGGHQAARKLIDEGAIGRVVGASAFMTGRGPEAWHPNPEFFYQDGGGPLMDLGPYYLTALTMMIGPVKKVTSCSGIVISPRIAGAEGRKGQEIEVTTPDHVAGSLEFENGALGTVMMSFAVWASALPRIEVYGTEGTLSVPDPNTFGGPVKLFKADTKEWQEVEIEHGYTENSRSLGLADMAYAIRFDRPHRATGQQAYHVLEVMDSLLKSAENGSHCDIKSTFTRPEPLPVCWPDEE